jgi:sugar phosphate isomerase/epimerase
MNERVSRRDVLAGAGLGVAAGLALGGEGTPARAVGKPRKGLPFRYCLNTSTLRGHNLSLPQEIEIAAQAGYDALEPWIGEIDAYVKGGGSLVELRRRIRDHGLTVESAIGFFEWIVDDESRRARGLEEARRNMDLVRQIGGLRLAAPPVGATDRSDIDLNRAAARYRALLDLGEKMGVVPQAEVWGFSRTLGTLAEAAHVAIGSGHPEACVLPDVYHLYKGGSPIRGVKLLSASALHVLHVNDYPAEPPREKISDADRVYPGDGIAPLDALFRDLREIGYEGVLSLELFNRDYWKQDALTVARTGLEKTRAVVRRALASRPRE